MSFNYKAMSLDNFPSEINSEQEFLKKEIQDKTKELERLEKMVAPFENELVCALEAEIIEVQELTNLYKKIQREKKEKRLAQKKKGKNYVAPVGLVPTETYLEEETASEKKIRKVLYREAMVCVHPDKFSMDSDQKELATDVSGELIELYQNGSLEELKAFHAYVLSGRLLELKDTISVTSDIDPNEYLEIQFQKITLALRAFKKKQTYIVLTTYANPRDFIDELKVYYSDRIFKLSKRTRKARKS